MRRSRRSDARAISIVRVETWRVAYRGLLGDALLAALDVDADASRRAERWDEHHSDPRAAEFVAESDGEVVGWASAGPSRDPDAVRTGELYALYVLPQFWSTGVGHVLLAAVEKALCDAGFSRALLWVLDGNERAAAFYERHGWSEDGAAKTDDRLVGDSGVPALNERRRLRDLRAQPGIRSANPS